MGLENTERMDIMGEEYTSVRQRHKGVDRATQMDIDTHRQFFFQWVIHTAMIQLYNNHRSIPQI